MPHSTSVACTPFAPPPPFPAHIHREGGCDEEEAGLPCLHATPDGVPGGSVGNAVGKLLGLSHAAVGTGIGSGQMLEGGVIPARICHRRPIQAAIIWIIGHHRTLRLQIANPLELPQDLG